MSQILTATSRNTWRLCFDLSLVPLWFLPDDCFNMLTDEVNQCLVVDFCRDHRTVILKKRKRKRSK